MCPLCEGEKSQRIDFNRSSREFFRCNHCDLIFSDRENLIGRDQERVRYEMHDNSIRSEGYLNFLSRLVKTVGKYVKEHNKKGLDFGSGPYPMLLELFYEQGFKNVQGWDPFFNKNQKVWNEKFHFITLCEVIEHVAEVKQTWESLLNLLEPEGIIVISTGIIPENDLSKWHYVGDPTHVSFFSEKTFKWMAGQYQLKWSIEGKDLVTFWKK